MSTLPSDEALVIESNRVYRAIRDRGDSASIAEIESCRAVARLAIEHYRAELVKASGVDVEALARLTAIPLAYSDKHMSRCVVSIAAAIRTAIAQTVARTLYVVSNDPLNAADWNPCCRVAVDAVVASLSDSNAVATLEREPLRDAGNEPCCGEMAADAVTVCDALRRERDVAAAQVDALRAELRGHVQELRQHADALEAARYENDGLRGDVKHWRHAATTLLAKVERMRPVVGAACAWIERLAELGHYRDGVPGDLMDAIDAYRRAKEKP